MLIHATFRAFSGFDPEMGSIINGATKGTSLRADARNDVLNIDQNRCNGLGTSKLEERANEKEAEQTPRVDNFTNMRSESPERIVVKFCVG